MESMNTGVELRTMPGTHRVSNQETRVTVSSDRLWLAFLPNLPAPLPKLYSCLLEKACGVLNEKFPTGPCV